MARKKTKYEQIPSERVRSTTLKRRLNGLFKKAHELSVLCDVDVAVIVHNTNEGNSMLWPSPEKVMNDVERFLSIPDRERIKKMVLQENLLMDRVQEMSDRISKLQKKNEEMEMGLVMSQLINGKTFNELEVRQLNGLSRLVEEKLKKLQTRNDALDGAQSNPSVTDVEHHCHTFSIPETSAARQSQNNCAPVSTPITTLMQDMGEDNFWSDTMFGIPNNLNFWTGTDLELEPTKAGNPFIDGNQGELDFSELLSSIFTP